MAEESSLETQRRKKRRAQIQANRNAEEHHLILQADLFLRDLGWVASRRIHRPVDRRGNPLPWFTYAAISFLEPRLNKDLRVFEYGAGGGTLWWAERVGSIVAAEHAGEWAKRIGDRAPDNATVHHIPIRGGGEAYARSAVDLGKFDLIVVDGRHRVACTKSCVEALNRRGVVVFDNSDRKQYAEGYEHLRSKGFKSIDFAGPGPINRRAWQTSVFYKRKNCLDI